MPTQTPIHGFDLPVVGADPDAWGGFLNGNWSDLDTLLAIDASATFMPVAGGTFSGAITFAVGATFDTTALFTGIATFTVPPISAVTPTTDTQVSNKLYVDVEVGVAQTDLTTHKADVANPHVVTAAQVAAVALSGDTMTGQLTLPGGGAGLEAINVAEVDAELVLKANLNSPIFTGTVTVNNITIASRVVIGAQILTSSAAIALSMFGGSKKTIDLATDTTITISDEAANQTVEVWITQTGGGGTAAWVGVDKWIGGVAPTLSAITGEIDIIVLSVESDGITVIGQHIGVAS